MEYLFQQAKFRRIDFETDGKKMETDGKKVDRRRGLQPLTTFNFLRLALFKLLQRRHFSLKGIVSRDE
jgi:hypothetical protein